MYKKKLADFICAFAIFTILLFFIAAVTQLDSFDNSFFWDRENLSLSAFGTTIRIDKRIPYVFDRLLSFNDLYFGKGFSEVVKNTGKELGCFISDAVRLCFEFTKDVVGAK
ncbi:MAG: hypothetical protein E7600_04600 [Ruminococcaceae bacterium]|nr:hypothetical protein [Oscillospiraceae bacterium]